MRWPKSYDVTIKATIYKTITINAPDIEEAEYSAIEDYGFENEDLDSIEDIEVVSCEPV